MYWNGSSRKAFALSAFLVFSLALVLPASAALQPVGLDETGYLSLYRESSYGLVQQGTALADAEDYAAALPHLRKAVDLNSGSVIAQFNLAFALMEVAPTLTDPAARFQMLEEAEWTFLRVQSLNPDLSLTYYKLGKLAMMREDFKQARAYYQSGLDANPTNAALWFNYGVTSEKQQDFQAAEEAYQKVIQLNPRFVYAYNNLGLLYEQRQAFELAEAAYRQALDQLPDYNFARLNLGSLMQAQGRLEEAEDLYREAIELEPDNAWAHLYLGNTFYRKGDYSQALEAYNKTISLNPSYPTTYFLASLALKKLNRNQEAMANGIHYIHLAPNGAFSREAGELILILRGESEGAHK